MHDQRDSIARVASQDGRFTVFAWSPCEAHGARAPRGSAAAPGRVSSGDALERGRCVGRPDAVAGPTARPPGERPTACPLRTARSDTSHHVFHRGWNGRDRIPPLRSRAGSMGVRGVGANRGDAFCSCSRPTESSALVRLYWAQSNGRQFGRDATADGRRPPRRRPVHPAGPERAWRDHRPPRIRRLLASRDILYLTCLHELGHAFGLAHSRNFDDVMYSFRSGGDILRLLRPLPRAAASQK